MAFEKNRTILYQMMDQGDFGLDEAGLTAFMVAPEPERVDILNQVFQKDIARFETIPLWEGDAPGYDSAIPHQNAPQIAFFPGEGDGRHGVVLVAPGGGYNCKASMSEGYPVIRRLCQAGFSAALLDYRVKPYNQYLSVQDINRAVRVLRHRADELRINPDKIAVSGGSAGGHLSTMAAVHYDGGRPDAADPVERVSSRPDAAVISYGVFSQVAFPIMSTFIKMSDDPATETTGLISSYSDRERAAKHWFSPEKHVTPDTPPFFMWQTCDEDDPRFLFNFAKELADCGVRFEAHIFPYGPHGMSLADGTGLGPGDEHVAHWFELTVEWLRINGF